MKTYTSYDLVEFGEHFEARQQTLPEPTGKQVLLRVTRAGVCHSDLHMIEGSFDLGEEGILRMADRGMKLPITLGHEIAGEVVACGPDAGDMPSGQPMLVFPWIGCGECRACADERENDCMKMRIIGLVENGGYATHVLVPDPKFLVDIQGLDPDTVTPHACSGLTVYNALTKLGSLREGEWLAVLGAGGLGLNAIAIAVAMGHENIVAVDIGDEKLPAASAMGAKAVLNGTRDDAIDALRELTGNELMAVLDTVGAASTARLAVHALVKTGRYVVVGLHGGDFRMPQPWLPQKAMTIAGCHVGSSQQLRDLIDMVRAGKVREIPVEIRPLSQVNAALDDLRDGKVTGRIVLSTD